MAVSFAPANIRECVTESGAPAPCAPSGSVPRATSPAAFFVESGLAAVAVGFPSQPARAIMPAAKNNRRHLDITPCVQICAVLRLLYDTDPGVMNVGAEVLAGKRSQLVKALGARLC